MIEPVRLTLGTQRSLFAFGLGLLVKAGRASGVLDMKQVFDQLLKFLHEGISAIFRFVEIIWTWSVEQISKLMAVPWQEWPLWKQFLLVLILAGVIWALYRAGRELLEAGAAILGAFAHLLGVLVRTLPHVMLAGIIALGGVWLVNHLDNSALRMPTWLQASQQNSPPPSSPPENRQSSPASGQPNSSPQDKPNSSPQDK